MISEIALLERQGEKFTQNTLKKIAAQYEKNENPTDNLPFHNTAHAGLVAIRTRRIMELMADTGVPLSPKSMLVGELAAVSHDFIQDSTIVTRDKDGYQEVMRQRHTGQNERSSARYLTDWMCYVNEKRNQTLFEAEDFSLAIQAIIATTPENNSIYKTVTHPYLTPESHPVVRAVTFADIGSAGLCHSQFLKDGDDLFREERLHVAQILETPDMVTTQFLQGVREEILQWSEGQIAFAKGRALLFDEETIGLSQKTKRALRDYLFTEFTRSAYAAKVRARERIKMTPYELLQDLGYQTIPSSIVHARA